MGNASFGYNTDDKVPDADKFHDVMLCLYMSDLIYTIGILRSRCGDLGYTTKMLKEELTHMCTDNECKKKDGLAKLLTGKFKLKDEDKDGLPDPPEFDFSDLEKFIEDPKFEKFTTPAFVSRCANGLTVVSLESFKSSSVSLYQFDAKFDQMDLVYAIAVRTKKPHNDLVLTFRGSCTYRDWWQNFQAPLVDIQLNKVGDKAYFIEGHSHTAIEIDIGLYTKLDEALSLEDAVDGQLKRIPIKIHQGFLGYLFNINSQSKHGSSKYNQIRKNILNLSRLNSGAGNNINSIYVTGHSLGGALATLASFFLACDKEVSSCEISGHNKTIKCIAFAGPSVGNVGFQRAMAVLADYKKGKDGTWRYEAPVEGRKSTLKNEKTPLVSNKASGHLRLDYIRFTNDRDYVPLLNPLTKYRQTGTEVHLQKSAWGAPAWKCSIQRDFPVMDNSSTSLWTGLRVTVLPFIGCLLTTLPALVLVLYVIAYGIFKILFPVTFIRDFSTVISIFFMKPMYTHAVLDALALSIVVQVSMGLIRKYKSKEERGSEYKNKEERGSEFLLEHIKKQIIALAIGVVYVLGLLHITMDSSNVKVLVAVAVFIGTFFTRWCLIQPMTDWTRVAVVTVTVPSVLIGTLYLINEEWPALFFEYAPMAIPVALILSQILMLVRSPWQITSAETHLLADYFHNLRPHHEILSRSSKIMDNANTK